jgi:hypothetical protein
VPIADDMGSSIYRPCKRGTKSAGVAFSPIASFTTMVLVSQTNVTVRYRIVGPLPGGTEVYNQTIRYHP